MRFTLSIILVLLSQALLAQAQYYNILNEDNGLLTNEVYDIHFSKEGFLYIAGDKGLQKYDGAKLERILPSWNKSLSWIKDDQYGGMIFQSFDSKYWRYANDSTQLIFDNGAELIYYKRFDISQGRYVALAGRENMYWYDALNKTIDTVRVHSLKHRNGKYMSLDIIGVNDQGAFGNIKDTLFFSTNRSGNTQIIPTQQIGDAYNLREVINFKGTEYYVVKSDASNMRRIDIYELANEKFIKKYSLGSYPDDRFMNTIRTVNERLYLLTSNGYWELDDQFQPKHKKAKLSSLAISQIADDGKGGLYISTLTKGVFYKPALKIVNASDVFLNQRVKAFDDTQDELFFLNEQGSLYNLQKKKRISAVPTSSILKFSKHKSSATSLLLYGMNTFENFNTTFFLDKAHWHGSQMFSYTKVSGWFELGNIYAGGNRHLNFNFQDTILAKAFYDRYKCNNYVDFIRNRRIIYNPLNKKSISYYPINIRNQRAYDFLPLDSKETFYVAYDDSLFHYYLNKVVKPILGNDNFGQKYKSKNLEIKFLHKLSNGHIWAGGLRGFMRIENDSVLQYYDADNGLPSSRLEFMKGFGDTVLLGFAKSVSLFTEEKGIFQTYKSATTFDKGTINDAHIFKGELYVSAGNQVFKLPITNRIKNAPKAFIRYISANGTRWDTNTSIPFDKNNISIRVNGLNINSGGAFAFYYRLNKNEDWVKQSNAFNDIRFNSLTEGQYNFQLKVVNQWGEESEIVAQSFKIAPPFFRSWPFYILCLLVAGAITYFIFWRRGKAIRRKAEFDKQVKQSEITAIKAQMNPHFVFNALNSIQNWVITKDVENSNLYLGKFSDLVRKTLEASEKNALPLSKEIEIIQLYLDLENLRFGDKINIDFDVQIEPNRQDEIYIPAMLIQPYIENVFKHGLLHKKGDKELRVLFAERNGKFYCEIKDNGVGREKAKRLGKKSKKYKSFSTVANRKRIDLLNEIYNDEIELKISDVYAGQEDTGTMIQLWLPIVDYDLQTEANRSQE